MQTLRAKQPSSLFYELVVRSWWVWLFAIICYGVYDYATMRQMHAREAMLENLAHEEAHLQQLTAEAARLQQRLDSQSDPAYMELVLMDNLGLVPEGQQKVYFAP